MTFVKRDLYKYHYKLNTEGRFRRVENHSHTAVSGGRLETTEKVGVKGRVSDGSSVLRTTHKHLEKQPRLRFMNRLRIVMRGGAFHTPTPPPASVILTPCPRRPKTQQLSGFLAFLVAERRSFS